MSRDEILAMIQQALDELEAEGILRKTGEFRMSVYKKEQLNPVYVLTDLGAQLEDSRMWSPDATLEAVDAERILKFAFLQQVWRLDAVMTLEKQGLPQPNGHREMDMIRKIGLGILDLEMLHGHNANMAEPTVRKKSRISKKIINEAEQESDDGLEDDDGLEADVETSF